MRPLLADAALKPAPADIAWTRDAFRDLLRIRASTPLFRLRTAADVQRRLRFDNVGPEQEPLVIAGHLDGEGMPGAAIREVLYLVNVSPESQSLRLPEEAGKAYVLHPLQAGRGTRSIIARSRRVTTRDGGFTVPGRTAVVFVIETGGSAR